MFPRLKQRLGTGVLARLDVLVELSTLGEYGVSEDGRPLALADQAPPPAPLTPRTRDACSPRGAASVAAGAAMRRRGAPPARS